MTADPKTVDDYLDTFDGEVRTRLDTVRRLIHDTAPEAVEGLSYGLVGYKLDGKPLVYFGGFAQHIGLYPTPAGQEAFTERLTGYKTGKGSVQLPLSQSLPIKLVRDIIAYRVSAIRE